MIAQSSAYAYFPEMVVGRSENVDVEEKECQDGSLWDDVFEAL